MHWDHLHRQMRVEGPVVKAPAADSDAYFASRPWQSRLGAWASEQSEPVGSRKDLLAALAAAAKRFGTLSLKRQCTRSRRDYRRSEAASLGAVIAFGPNCVELWVEGEARDP